MKIQISLSAVSPSAWKKEVKAVYGKAVEFTKASYSTQHLIKAIVDGETVGYFNPANGRKSILPKS